MLCLARVSVDSLEVYAVCLPTGLQNLVKRVDAGYSRSTLHDIHMAVFLFSFDSESLYAMCFDYAGDRYIDSGARVFDNVDGNLTAKLTSRGVAGVVDTSHPTQPTKPYVIVYSAVDSSQNIAIPAYRQVSVICRQVGSSHYVLLLLVFSYVAIDQYDGNLCNQVPGPHYVIRLN